MSESRVYAAAAAIRGALWVVALVGTLVTLLAAGSVFGLDAESGVGLDLVAVAKWSCLAIAAVYSLACARRLRATSWFLLAAGCVCYFAAQSVFLSYHLRGLSAPFPSAADPAFLLGILLFAAGGTAFLRELATSGFPLQLRERLPRGLVLVLGAGTVLSLAMLRPLLPPASWNLETVLSLLYPAFDLLLLVPAVLLLQVTGGFGDGKIRRVWSVLAVAFLLFLVGDLLFALLLDNPSQVLSAAVDVSYIWGYAGLGFASLRQLDLSH